MVLNYQLCSNNNKFGLSMTLFQMIVIYLLPPRNVLSSAFSDPTWFFKLLHHLTARIFLILPSQIFLHPVFKSFIHQQTVTVQGQGRKTVMVQRQVRTNGYGASTRTNKRLWHKDKGGQMVMAQWQGRINGYYTRTRTVKWLWHMCKDGKRLWHKDKVR